MKQSKVPTYLQEWNCRNCGRFIPMNDKEKEFLCAMCHWKCRLCGHTIPMNDREKKFLYDRCKLIER